MPLDVDKYPQVLKFSKFDNGSWSKPETAPFSGRSRDGGPAFSPDGNRIYFYSRRPLQEDAEGKHDNDIWYVEKKGTGWRQPVNLGNPVNTPYVEQPPVLLPMAIYILPPIEINMRIQPVIMICLCPNIRMELLKSR